MSNTRVKIGNTWFDRYGSGEKTFLNYRSGRVIPWKNVDKSTVQAIGFAPTRKYVERRE